MKDWYGYAQHMGMQVAKFSRNWRRGKVRLVLCPPQFTDPRVADWVAVDFGMQLDRMSDEYLALYLQDGVWAGDRHNAIVTGIRARRQALEQ